jgi:hypothetical protein
MTERPLSEGVLLVCVVRTICEIASISTVRARGWKNLEDELPMVMTPTPAAVRASFGRFPQH